MVKSQHRNILHCHLMMGVNVGVNVNHVIYVYFCFASLMHDAFLFVRVFVFNVAHVYVFVFDVAHVYVFVFDVAHVYHTQCMYLCLMLHMCMYLCVCVCVNIESIRGLWLATGGENSSSGSHNHYLRHRNRKTKKYKSTVSRRHLCPLAVGKC